MLAILAESIPVLENLASYGVAGLMGAMWLWERRVSQRREQQIDESHARILADRVQLDQLLDVVRQNADALSRLSALQEQVLSHVRSPR